MGKVRCALWEERTALASLPRRAPPGLLHEGHGHRATLGRRQDRPAPRLPRSDLAPLFCAQICCRAIGRPDEGPRHHRRGQGLVPGDGAHPHDLVPCSLPAPSSCATWRLPMPSWRAKKKTDVARRPGSHRGPGAGVAPRSLPWSARRTHRRSHHPFSRERLRASHRRGRRTAPHGRRGRRLRQRPCHIVV